jgi:hypothetical protein
MTYIVRSVLVVGNLLGIGNVLEVDSVLDVGDSGLVIGNSDVVIGSSRDRSRQVLRRRAVPKTHGATVMAIDNGLASNLLADFRTVVAVDGLAALE